MWGDSLTSFRAVKQREWLPDPQVHLLSIALTYTKYTHHLRASHVNRRHRVVEMEVCSL